MRKTRSQTHAENAVLSGSATSSSRPGVASSSTIKQTTTQSIPTPPQQQQQYSTNTQHQQKRNIQQPAAASVTSLVDPARLKVGFDLIVFVHVTAQDVCIRVGNESPTLSLSRIFLIPLI